MSKTVSIETASGDLEGLLDQLHPGETITLVGNEGRPRAILVSINPASIVETQSDSGWEEQWRNLAEEIGRAWKDDKSAAEVISEMRR